MALDADLQAKLEHFLKNCETDEQTLRSTLDTIAKELVSSDILLYNTIIHYQYENGIISHYDPKPIPSGYPSGAIELGPFLYFLVNEKPPSSWKTEYQLLWYAIQAAIIALVGQSAISPALYADLLTYIKTTGIPANDGSLIGLDMYQILDSHWLDAVIYYLYYKAFPKDIAPFNSTTTKPITLSGASPNQVKIAIIGDWGTGKYDPTKPYDQQDGSVDGPALDIMNALPGLAPDYIIHLGDVYYAGTDQYALINPNEEQNNLLDVWSSTNTTNFTLNSNHEMYGGANGYFNIALTNNLFAPQTNHSFFVLEYGNWVIIGLDSAYYCDNDNLYMDGRITDSTQKSLLNQYKNQTQNVILMSHHNALSYDGATIETLWNDVLDTDALGSAPAYWYWGHLHDGIVYSDKTAIGGASCTRCIGHSAIPYGEAWGLLDSQGNNIPTVEYFAHTPVDPSGKTSARVFNGFAIITLTDTTLTEQFYELDNTGTAVLKWSS